MSDGEWTGQTACVELDFHIDVEIREGYEEEDLVEAAIECIRAGKGVPYHTEIVGRRDDLHGEELD